MMRQVQHSQEEQIELVRRLRDPAWHEEYCRLNLKIQTKDARLITLEPTAIQKKFNDVVLPCLETGIRVIINKARQVKLSTASVSIGYKRTTAWEDIHGLFMSNQDTNTQYLRRMYQTFLDNSHPDLRPRLGSPGSADRISFKGLRSDASFQTAGGKLSTSGGTFHFVHASEVAKWEHPEETMLSLNPAIPKTAVMIIESTPFGIGNYFYRLWVAATEKQNEYIPLFFPWFENPEYRLDKVRRGEDVFDADPNEQQRYYVDVHGLDQQQVNWMVSTVATECGGDFDSFLQEFPFDPESCFLSSGQPYFDMGALRELDLGLRKEVTDKVVGVFDSDGIFVQNERGDVTLWDMPNPEEKIAYRYVVSADTCGGGGGIPLVDDGQKRKGDSDWNYCIVRDKVLNRQVGEIRNKKDPDQFAFQCYQIVKMFGNGLVMSYWPLLIFELNNTGQAFAVTIRDLWWKHKIPFSRLFHRGDMSKDYEPTLKELGFVTGGSGEAPRMAILSEIQRRVREGLTGVQSVTLVGQCLTFIRNDKRRDRPEAQEGRYDDGVMALALNYEGERKDNPPWELPKPQQVPKWIERKQKQAGLNKGNRYA